MAVNEYGLFTESFFDSLTPEERVFFDYEVRNRLIDTLNKSEEERQKEEKERSEHPGMERYQDPEDFWDEVGKANKEREQNKDMEVQ
jgi:hypothetical protein